ncbi:cytochrome P450 [Lentinula edodes]|uniref:Cytochrome P450 n=1 Tax=Lentinula lateritia TaxID=40482 RepID=A0A9W8ZSU0_9AGAR|nr:cytochrome P450 [Lentinula edodes]
MGLTSASVEQQYYIGLAVVALLTSGLFIWYHHCNYGPSGADLPLPPGPRKLPLIGNVLDMPATNPHITFARWGKQFDSDILHLNVLGVDYIVLNSYEAIIDLLDKRSGIYSSRPHFTMLQDLIGWEGDLLFLSWGKALNAHKKLFHQEFHPSNSAIHRPHEKKALSQFLNNLIDTPEEWGNHLKQMIGAIIIGVAYGVQVQPMDDPNIDAAAKMYSVLNRVLIPGAFLVDTLPILKYIPSWFPGASFKQQAKAWYGIRKKTIMPPFVQVKQAMMTGTAEDSFTLRCLANDKDIVDPCLDHLSAEEEMIMQTAGTLYEGGADTGNTALRSFILAMMCFPDAQQHAQEELDCVIGEERLPDYGDLDMGVGLGTDLEHVSLPYVCALVMECFRWQTVAPLAIPHLVDAEDTYKGYYIPKGATVLPNIWAILRDEKRYGPTVDTFDPRRWLLQRRNDDSNDISSTGAVGGTRGESQWTLNPEMIIHNPIPMSFGFGRRVCPGKHMALSTFQINVVSLLHCFDITPPVDGDGNQVMPEIKYVTRLTSGPAPYKCSIKPRSEKHVVLVQQMLIDE